MTHTKTTDLNYVFKDISFTPKNHNIAVAWLPNINSSVPFNIIAAAHYSVGDKHITERMDRDDYQILLTVKGEGCVIYEKNEYILTPNSFLFVDCRKSHKYYVRQGKTWEFKHIHFNLNYDSLLNAIPIYRENCPQASIHFDQLAEFACSKNSPSNISHFIYSNFIENLLISVIIDNFNQISISDIDSNHSVSFSQIMNHIHNHYDKEISISDLAKKFNYSESYFIRSFKKLYNCTPHQYLIKYRISKVFEHIAKGETVESAALRCGFNSTSAFYYSLNKHKQDKDKN